MDSKDKKYFDTKAAEIAAETKRCARAATAAGVAANAAALKAARDDASKRFDAQAKQLADLAKSQKGINKIQAEQSKKLDAIIDTQADQNEELERIKQSTKVNGLAFAIGAILGAILGVLVVMAFAPEGFTAVMLYIMIPFVSALAIGWGIEGLFKPLYMPKKGGTP